MPTWGGIEDLKRHLYNKRKKDIDWLAKAANSLKLRPRPKAYYLDIWVCKMDNFFKMLIV
jgi:hypothetical protein